MSLDFGYIVDENQAKAKFINAKGLLKLSIPVIKAKNPLIVAESTIPVKSTSDAISEVFERNED